MLPESLAGPAQGLFLICVAASAAELIVRDDRSSAPFHALCALAVAMCALRLVAGLLKQWLV